MLTESQLQNIETLVWSGLSLRAAIEKIDEVPSIQLLSWLRENHYERFTDAKKGVGHTQAQDTARKAMKGTG